MLVVALEQRVIDAIPLQISLLPAKCQNNIRNVICMSIYQSCFIKQTEFEVMRPCRVNCQKIHYECGYLYPLFIPTSNITNLNYYNYINCNSSLYSGTNTTSCVEPPPEIHVLYAANEKNVVISESIVGSSVEVYPYDSTYRPSEHYPELRAITNSDESSNDASVSNGVCSGLIRETYIPDIRYLSLLPNYILLNSTANVLNAKYQVVDGSHTRIDNAEALYGYIDSATSMQELKPMAAPYVFQSYIEFSLVTLLEVLPVWLESTCQARMHEYFCLSSYLQPKQMSVKELFDEKVENGVDGALAMIHMVASMIEHPPSASFREQMGKYSNLADVLDYTFTIPGYPDLSVCTRYKEECGGYIDSVMNDHPSLSVECNATMTLPITYLDIENGVLIDHHVPLFSGSAENNGDIGNPFNSSHLTIAIYNQSKGIAFWTNNTATIDFSWPVADTSPYVTLCPHGFVIPDNPSDPRTQWIPNTGCAIACKIPLFTDSEWDSFIFLARLVSYIGLLLVLLLLFTQLIDPVKRMQHMVTCLAFVSMVHTVMSCITHSYDPNDRLCVDNNVPYEASDGLWNICAVQSFFNIFVTYAVGICWLMQSIDLTIRIDSIILWTTGSTEVKSYWKVYVGCIVVVPTILTLISFFMNKFGYEKGDIVCVFSTQVQSDHFDVWIFYIPIFLYAFCGSIALMTASYQRHVNQVLFDQHKVGTLHIGRTTLYHVWFLVLWIVIISTRLGIYIESPVYIKSFVDWVICSFEHYNGLEESVTSVCGATASVRLSPHHQRYFIIATVGQSIFVSISHLASNGTFRSWRDWLHKRGVNKSRVYPTKSDAYQVSKPTQTQEKEESLVDEMQELYVVKQNHVVGSNVDKTGLLCINKLPSYESGVGSVSTSNSTPFQQSLGTSMQPSTNSTDDQDVRPELRTRAGTGSLSRISGLTSSAHTSSTYGTDGSSSTQMSASQKRMKAYADRFQQLG